MLFPVFLVYLQLVLINTCIFFSKYMVQLNMFARIHSGTGTDVVRSKQIEIIIKGRVKNRLHAPNTQGKSIHLMISQQNSG